MKLIEKYHLVEYMKNHTKEEAALHFDVSVPTLSRRLKEFGLTHYELKYGNCVVEQDILDGILLGKGTINGSGRMRICSTNEEYIRMLEVKLHPFIKQIRKRVSWEAKTITSQVFRILRKSWYSGSKKRVSKNIIFNEKTVAYWFMESGKNHPLKRLATISTQKFRFEDVLFLISKLKSLGITSTYQKRDNSHVIAISCKDYFKFMEMISPHCFDCVKQKCDTANAVKAKWTSRKLTYRLAAQIRELYNEKTCRQKDLADMFGVSVSTIWKVVNNKLYPNRNFGLSGTADVKVTFN